MSSLPVIDPSLQEKLEDSATQTPGLMQLNPLELATLAHYSAIEEHPWLKVKGRLALAGTLIMALYILPAILELLLLRHYPHTVVCTGIGIVMSCGFLFFLGFRQLGVALCLVLGTAAGYILRLHLIRAVPLALIILAVPTIAGLFLSLRTTRQSL